MIEKDDAVGKDVRRASDEVDGRDVFSVAPIFVDDSSRIESGPDVRVCQGLGQVHLGLDGSGENSADESLSERKTDGRVRAEVDT